MSDKTSASATCHPLYNERRLHLKFMRLAYLGGEPYIERYLTPHPKERTASFERRIERAVYPNLCKVQVDTYAAQLYRSPVQRALSLVQQEGESAEPAAAGQPSQAPNLARAQAVLSAFWDNADRLNNSADTFFKGVAVWTQVLGLSAVLIDKAPPDPSAPPAASLADEDARGLRPFARHIQADQILDWETDDDGEFEWFLYAHEASAKRQPLDPAPQGMSWGHTLWTRDEVLTVEWQQAEAGVRQAAGWVVTSRRSNPLGVVPLELVFWGQRIGKHPAANSALDDLAPMNRRLMNLISLVDEEIYQHVFNILAVGESTFNNLQAANWSVAGVLKIGSAEGEFPPTYLAPGVEQIRAISDEVEKTIRFMRMLSGNPGRGADDGLVPPSGVSLAYQSSDKFALFKEFSGRLSDLERRCADLVLAWQGIDPRDYTANINYTQDFDPVLVAKTFEDALAFQALNIQGDPAIENECQVIRRHFASSLSAPALDAMVTAHREARRSGAAPASSLALAPAGQQQEGSAGAPQAGESASQTAQAGGSLNF